MRVSDLYQKPPLADRDVYIVGTGPSLRVFPLQFLQGRTCILLNAASRLLGPAFGPVAFANNKSFLEGCECPYQIVKGRLRFETGAERTDNHVAWDDPSRYVFSYRQPPWDASSHFDPIRLWAEPDFYWNCKRGSVAIFAVQFAALAGARSITLVGCDCAELPSAASDGIAASDLPYAGKSAGDHAGRVRHDYDQYAAGLNYLCREVWDRFRCPIMHLSPFPGYGREREQFVEFRRWRDNGFA